MLRLSPLILLHCHEVVSSCSKITISEDPNSDFFKLKVTEVVNLILPLLLPMVVLKVNKCVNSFEKKKLNVLKIYSCDNCLPETYKKQIKKGAH